jgi:hypothetical protein
VHRPFHSSHDKTASLGATAFQHRLSMTARSILYPGVGTSRQERKSRCRAVWSLGALLAYCVLALCPLAIAQQYPILPVAGSPKNIRFLFQDSKGRLWVGGDRLACFDGARFYSLTDYGFPAVPSYAVSEDSGGAIWIGAATGIYRYSGGRVQEVSKGATVSVVAVSPDLVLAAVGPMGKGVPATASLVRASRKGDSWKTETIMDLDSASPLTLDHAGMVLYPWPKQGWNELRLEDIVRWRQGEKLVVTHHPIAGRQATAPAAGPMRVQRDRFGCVWLGSDTSNIYQCGHDQWRAAPFEGASVRSNFTEAADGLRMRDDREDDIFIALDFELKAPIPRYSALPDVEGFAVFFCAQRWMRAVDEQETQLFAERLADNDRQACIVLVGFFSKAQLHFRGFFAWRLARESNAAMAASALA